MSRLLPLALVLSACSGYPSEDDLYGFWANLEMGTVRGFEFAPSMPDDPRLDAYTDVFVLYVYQGGSTPIPVQRGTFSTERYDLGDGEVLALVQNIVWAEDSILEGQTFGNEFIDHEDSQFTLDSATASTGQRTFMWVEELP